jgi:hypothetical protein
MVDERGRDEKIKYANGGRRVENGMRDNYQFILPVRASHFSSMSKTVSIPEDLGCQCNWRTCHSRRGIQWFSLACSVLAEVSLEVSVQITKSPLFCHVVLRRVQSFTHSFPTRQIPRDST